MSKTKMMTWPIGMFGYDFSLCLDEASWKKHWNKIDPEYTLDRRPYPPSYGGTTFFAKDVTKYTDKAHAVVTINPPDDRGIELAAIFCHEAVHIKQEICKVIQEEKMSDEVEAYLVQYISYGLMDMYKEMAL